MFIIKYIVIVLLFIYHYAFLSLAIFLRLHFFILEDNSNSIKLKIHNINVLHISHNVIKDVIEGVFFLNFDGFSQFHIIKYVNEIPEDIMLSLKKYDYETFTSSANAISVE